MKTNLSIFLIFLSLLFSSLSSLFAQMNAGIMGIEENVANLLTTRNSEVAAIAHSPQESGVLINTEALHEGQEKILEPAFKVPAQGVDGITEAFAAEGHFEGRVSVIASQIEEAKQASKERLGGENSYLWDSIATKLEQAQDSWNKVNELLDQGKQERASLWKKAAEESEVSAEGLRKAVQAYISGEKKTAEQLEKETWGGYYLSDTSTWLLKLEEAREKADQMQGEDEEFWRNLAKQYQVAIDYERKALEAHDLGKEDKGSSWAWAGRSIHSSVEYQIKAYEWRNSPKTTLADSYRKAASLSEYAAFMFKQSLLPLGVGIYYGKNCVLEGECLLLQVKYQAKACEAEEAINRSMSVAYKNAVATLERTTDLWKQTIDNIGIEARQEFDGGWYGMLANEQLKKQVDYQIKAIEAREAGKEELMDRYRKIIETSQKASEYFLRASENQSPRSNECQSIGWYLRSKVDKQVNTIEKTQGKKLEKNNIIYSYLVEDDNDININFLLKEQRINISKKNKEMSLYCKKWITETGLISAPEAILGDYVIKPILSDYVMDILKRKADYRLVEAFEKYRSYVIKAHDGENDSLALAWIQLAEDIQQTIEESIKKNKISGTPKLLKAWEDVIESELKMAEYRSHYMKLSLLFQNSSLQLPSIGQSSSASVIEESNSLRLFNRSVPSAPYSSLATETLKAGFQNSDVINGRKKIVEEFYVITDYYRKAAEACALNNEQEYNRFKSAADAMKESVKKLEAAITAVEKSLSTSDQPEISTLWRKVVEQYEIYAECDVKVAEAELAGNVEEVVRLKEAASVSEIAAKEAMTAAENVVKGIESNSESLVNESNK
ncbi:MAG TPA: hypothetical protein VJK54_07285 [Chthoniobacterales bacterium]|nr:hypothetical protein [Chthoniobacterales bacterium]